MKQDNQPSGVEEYMDFQEISGENEGLQLIEGKDYVICVGDTMTEAIEDGITSLGLGMDDVDIEILQEPDEEKDAFTVKITRIARKIPVAVEEEVVFQEGVEAEGRTLNQAINEGLRKLGVKKEEADVDVIDEPLEPGGLYRVRVMIIKEGEEEEREKEFRPLNITLSHDDTEAYISLLHPFTGGSMNVDDGDGLSLSGITLQDIENEIKAHKIVHGIMPEEIEGALKSYQDGKDVVNRPIARGMLPVPGKDDIIKHHVDLTPSAGRLDTVTGKIDFRERNIINTVEANAILATRIALSQGVPGKTVTGRKVMPAKGIQKRLKVGKNVEIIEEDGGVFQYVSKVDGCIELKEDRLDVNEVTVIKGDVDYSTGNINAGGTIHVEGGIAPGFRIKAGKDIIVNDLVESAHLEAGGDIRLISGMKGQDKGRLVARGSITAPYLERAYVESGSDIEVANSVVECTVLCGGKLVVTSGKGMIIRGVIKAARGVEAKRIGSPSYKKTTVIVGIHYRAEKNLSNIRRELKRCSKDAEKLKYILAKTSKFSVRSEEIKGAIHRLENDKEILKKRENLLIQNIRKRNWSTISVSDIIYPMVNLIIGGSHWVVDKEIRNVVFYEDSANREIKCSFH